jgi:hypothetical protein
VECPLLESKEVRWLRPFDLVARFAKASILMMTHNRFNKKTPKEVSVGEETKEERAK